MAFMCCTAFSALSKYNRSWPCTAYYRWKEGALSAPYRSHFSLLDLKKKSGPLHTFDDPGKSLQPATRHVATHTCIARYFSPFDDAGNSLQPATRRVATYTSVARYFFPRAFSSCAIPQELCVLSSEEMGCGTDVQSQVVNSRKCAGLLMINTL